MRLEAEAANSGRDLFNAASYARKMGQQVKGALKASQIGFGLIRSKCLVRVIA